MNEYYDANDYAGLTEQQKRVLAPPFVGDRPNTVS